MANMHFATTVLTAALILVSQRAHSQKPLPLTLALNAPATVVSGQPCTLKVTLTNISDHALVIQRDYERYTGDDLRDAGYNYAYTVLLASGEALKTRAEQRQHGLVIQLYGFWAYETILPGALLTEEFDLNRRFDLTKPETYTVYAWTRLNKLPGKPNIISNRVAIHVVRAH